MSLSSTPLAGLVTLVTGAVGQLGRQYCRILSQAGAEVIVSDLDEEACRDFAAQLGAGARGLALDVGSPESVRGAFDRLDRLDILVNNAGIAVFEPFEQRSFEDFMRVVRVNAGGTFLCTQAALALLEKSRCASIVNIGSIYGLVAGDQRVYTDCDRNTSEVYAASKAAVIQMTRYFAVYLASRKIRVNCICPGGVYAGQGDDFVANYADRTPLGRMAREEEMNSTLIYLCDPSSSYVTGQVIAVDGGWTAW